MVTLKSVGSTKNPVWARCELVLALDLYLRTFPSIPAKTSEEIQGLSDLLNRLAKIIGIPNYSRYRNANGVYMKLMNFRAIDPRHTNNDKHGLTHGGKGDRQVWEEFAANPERCRRAAKEIQAAVGMAAASGRSAATGITQELFDALARP